MSLFLPIADSLHAPIPSRLSSKPKYRSRVERGTFVLRLARFMARAGDDRELCRHYARGTAVSKTVMGVYSSIEGSNPSPSALERTP
jgi:hypothetical protein